MNERGSSLILVPTCALIVVLFGGIMLDAGVTYYTQRNLDDFVTSTANRLAVSAVDQQEYYNSDGETLVLSQQRAEQLLSGYEKQAKLDPIHDLQFRVNASNNAVTVEAQGMLEPHFITGALARRRQLHAAAHADLIRH